MSLDRTDYRILHFLQNDARMPNTELSDARSACRPHPACGGCAHSNATA